VLTGWSALLLAGFLEIVWAIGLKYSDSLTRFWPTAIMVTAIALSFWLLAVSLKSVLSERLTPCGQELALPEG
jgi:quaternary ammonium compound-resistance protein SugE